MVCYCKNPQQHGICVVLYKLNLLIKHVKKAHKPLVRFTFFHGSGFIDLVFRKLSVSSLEKLAEMEARSKSNLLIQALTTLMPPYIVVFAVLVVSMEYRRSSTLDLDPNCRVKSHAISSSFTLKNFLIESM